MKEKMHKELTINRLSLLSNHFCVLYKKKVFGTHPFSSLEKNGENQAEIKTLFQSQYKMTREFILEEIDGP